MLYCIIKENTYLDSISLMVLSTEVGEMAGVRRATMMMGTPANIEIMKKTGFDVPELAGAKPSDLAIVFEAESDDVVAAVDRAVQALLREERGGAQTSKAVKTWREADECAADYDVCLISVPGEYAADEARAALERGKHVFLFSDNVSLEDERTLKQMAHERGLLVMGPDCGTGMLGGVPLGFANVVRGGGIGIVGASGTGIQEVAVQIHRMGAGLTNAVGTGGRDLRDEIGAISMLDAIAAMREDERTKVIVVISKPPSKRAEQAVIGQLRLVGKPVVVFFLDAEARARDHDNIHFAATTMEAAQIACRLSGVDIQAEQADIAKQPMAAGAKILGLFAGGTLACEAAMLAARSIGIPYVGHGSAGKMLDDPACEIIDLGDDCYTQGKPHPMIDGEGRNRFIRDLAIFEGPTVVLVDVVLGYGAEQEPALGLAEALGDLVRRNAQAGISVACVANLVGTEGDPQGLDRQRNILEAAGVRVLRGNVHALAYALSLTGRTLRAQAAWGGADWGAPPARRSAPAGVAQLLRGEPGVLNIGLRGFADDLEACKKRVVHFAWKPVAGGDKRLRRAIDYLDNCVFENGPYRTIDEANDAVVRRIQAGAPCLEDVVPAREVCDFLCGKALLHAGPPMRWAEMTSPMQGSCIGAALFEEWAATEEEARAMFARGEVEFMPCHHAGFVGPMGGITSGHMPVMQVRNRAEGAGNVAYCTMNEGIGAVLRFGAYSQEVVDRLRFMRDTLGPVLSLALKQLPEGLALNALIAKAIAMGDEFHQRNIAASMAFLREMAPLIVPLQVDDEAKAQVIRFLADTEQFFLNVMMAAAKAVMDDAATVPCGTVVTVMSRNGKDFGVRMSGTRDEWFTGPVNTPVGLYFSGYSQVDGNPDMGDSAITETYGVGGMAMIAAPAVTRFVGTGGFYDALDISNRMSEISIAHSAMFPIPNWDFKGICCGIDARKVVLSGITPIINTGIAHREAGRGQIGAGTVHPPIECFARAILTYARALGFEGE